MSLLGASLGALALASLVVLGRWWLEERRLARLARAPDLAALRAASRSLAEPVRSASSTLADGIEEGSSVESALLEGIREIARSPLGTGGKVGALVDVALVGVAAAPLVVPLLRAPGQVLEAMRALERQPLSRALAAATEQLAPAFETLARGYVEGGAALAALAVLWVLRSWLRGPEGREARAVEALLRAAVHVAPGAPARVAGRVAESLTPSRDLVRPVLAACFWLLAITASWLALVSTGPLRETRARPVTLELWPTGQEHPVEVPPGLELASTRGGRPVREGAALLAVGPADVRLGAVFLFEHDQGEWPEDWATRTRARLEAAGAVLEARLLVAAHGDLPAERVLDLLGFLAEIGGPLELDLLIARPAPELQAYVRARIADPPERALRAVLDASGRATVAGVAASPEGIAKRLRVAPRPVLALMPASGLSWADVLGVIGAADDSCPAAARRCAQPGIGVETVFPGTLSGS